MAVRDLEILSVDLLKSGETKGRVWNLYKVEAQTTVGERTPGLTAFFAPPLGKASYDVVRQERDGGVRYQLKPVKGAPKPPPEERKDWLEVLAAHQQAITELASRVSLLEGK